MRFLRCSVTTLGWLTSKRFLYPPRPTPPAPSAPPWPWTSARQPLACSAAGGKPRLGPTAPRAWLGGILGYAGLRTAWQTCPKKAQLLCSRPPSLSRAHWRVRKVKRCPCRPAVGWPRCKPVSGQPFANLRLKICPAVDFFRENKIGKFFARQRQLVPARPMAFSALTPMRDRFRRNQNRKSARLVCRQKRCGFQPDQ